MSLADFGGAANSPEMLPYLVGERILGAFSARAQGTNVMVLVLESGCSLVISTCSSYWTESIEDTQRRVEQARQQLQFRIQELRLLNAGVPGLPVTAR